MTADRINLNRKDFDVEEALQQAAAKQAMEQKARADENAMYDEFQPLEVPTLD